MVVIYNYLKNYKKKSRHYAGTFNEYMMRKQATYDYILTIF